MTAVGPLPPLLVSFTATVLFSFVIGLELHGYRRSNARDLGFGTTRTLTLIGVIGFTLDALDPTGLALALGLIVLSGLLAIYYWQRAAAEGFTLLPLLLAVLVYLLGPIAQHLPTWFLVLYVVVIILMLGEQPSIRQLSDAFPSAEGVTLAKFLILAGIILPLLPERQIAPFVELSYYQVWLAVIVVSGLSYLSYLAQHYFFPERGLLLTGVLGGLYSSTAASVVIARRAQLGGNQAALAAPALILASAMMYLRLWALILILGYYPIALQLLGPFAVVTGLSLLLAFAAYRRTRRPPDGANPPASVHHPLELSTALLFALLFVVFAGLSQWVIGRFGTSGLHVLAFVVGFTDIDPFILALLAGKFQVGAAAITAAVVLASGSNNLLKALYALLLGPRRAVLPAALWLILLCAASLGYALWLGRYA